MTMAENKFKGLVCTGEWNAPMNEQKEISALTLQCGIIDQENQLR